MTATATDATIQFDETWQPDFDVNSNVIGQFTYLPRPRGLTDEAEWNDDCAGLEQIVRDVAYEFLIDHRIDTLGLEVRLSEHAPGEIRVYW